jgi:hypothetical protein
MSFNSIIIGIFMSILQIIGIVFLVVIGIMLLSICCAPLLTGMMTRKQSEGFNKTTPNYTDEEYIESIV